MKTFLRMFTLFFTLVYFSLSSTLPVSAEHLQKQQLKVMLVDVYSLISISELCKAVDATYH